jgi:predicted GNAT family N-acyltransferase
MKFSILNHNDEKNYEILQLRNKILRLPLGLSLFDENLDDEKDELFFILEIENKIVASCQLKKIDDKTSKLRQMAVHEDFQLKGFGKKLIEFVENYAFQKRIFKIELHARISALDFYKNLNYNIVGNEFEEVNIPHIKMEKKIFTE